MNEKTRSIFVTATAWVFIVFAGMATLVSIAQNIMIRVMFKQEQFQEHVNQASAPEGMPDLMMLPLKYFDIFAMFMLAVALVVFVSAIGLLHRRNWARIVFIIFLALAIVWNVVGMVMTILAFQSMKMPVSAGFDRQFEIMTNVILVFNIIFMVVVSGLFAWIIKRLSSSDVQAEFEPGL